MQPVRRKNRVIIGLAVFGVILGVWWGYQRLAFYDLQPAKLWYLLTDPGAGLKGIKERTNILLLGVGGNTHEGGDLTDTIMVLSVDKKGNDSVLLSIPRDIWAADLKAKINSAYANGEAKKPGGGLTLSKATVEQIIGLPLQYGLLVDFNGFKSIIDAVGGIETWVADSFTDSKYPIAGKETADCAGDPEYSCRYETVSFTQGSEHMDGDLALKYVRSRH
ncbi:MAG: LCP family protein, partial [Patescibacteria group bacterium]